MRRFTTLMCAAALLPAGSSAHAAPAAPIGNTVSVVNLVTAELQSERRTLALGDPVRSNEVIEAAPDAKSEFRLADDTKLALGPGAKMVLDKFVYDPDKRTGDIVLDLTKGAFRFITGQASKPSYVVRVPNAAITVRGTIFDVFVQPNGTAWLLLHEGGVEVCNPRGTCRVLSEPGKMILVNDVGDIGQPFRWASLKGQQGFDFDQAFPFVGQAPSIDPKPNLTREAILKADEATEPKSAPAGKKDRKAEADNREADRSAKSAEVQDATPDLTTPRIKLKKPRIQADRTGSTGQDAGRATDGKGPTRLGSVDEGKVKMPKRTVKDSVVDDKPRWRKVADDARASFGKKETAKGQGNVEGSSATISKTSFNRQSLRNFAKRHGFID